MRFRCVPHCIHGDAFGAVKIAACLGKAVQTCIKLDVNSDLVSDFSFILGKSSVL